MVTTIELPSDKVYGRAVTDIRLEIGGVISIEYADEDTLEPIALAYLGKDEITKILEICSNPENLQKIMDGAEREKNRKKQPIDMSRPIAEGKSQEEDLIDSLIGTGNNGSP